jgi:hypothetical protein
MISASLAMTEVVDMVMAESDTAEGFARSVTGDTRRRRLWSVSIAESRAGADVNTIIGYSTSGELVQLAKGCSSWR